jgi:hypothetical protein
VILIVNIFEIITVVAVGVVAWVVYGKFPGYEGVFKILIAGISGVVGVFVVVWLVRLLAKGWNFIFPLRPRCLRGCCDSDDYLYKKTSSQGVWFECKCGGQYLIEGRSFREVTLHGEIRPYMKKIGLGKWVSDASR